MDKQKGRIVTLSILIVIGLTAGCAKAPQDAMDEATAALDAAKTAEADRYAPEMYQAAQDSMAAAQAEIEAQNAQMAFSRSYSRTRQILNATTTAARAAANAAPTGKEQMRAEVETILAEVPKNVTAVNRLIQRAAGRRSTREAANAAREAIAGVDKLLADARTAFEQGDIATAHQHASQARQAVEAARQQVS